MAEDFQDFQTEYQKNTVVQDVIVETEAGLGFDLPVETIGALTVTFLLQSYIGALLGKLAEETWDTIKRFVDNLDKKSRQSSKPSSNSTIRVVYRSQMRSTNIEIVIAYANIRALKRDLKNHREYIALGLGYAKAKLPRKESEISLLSCLPPENQGRVLEFIIQRAKDKQPNKK
jgi:hypothetical protein